MAWDSKISIEFDVEQPRTIKDWNLVQCQGSYDGRGSERVLGWDLSKSDGVAVDRATFTGFLAPYQQSPEWYANFTGDYARMAIADWTLSESAKWKPDETLAGGDIWLSGTELTQGSSGVTTDTFTKNRGFYIAYYDYNTVGEDNLILECGWNSSASSASGVSFKVYSSGKIAIYKDGEYRGQGSISGERSTQKEWSSFIVLPGRHRELMFIPNLSQGFTFEFPELIGEADPTITGATKFWFKCPRPTGHSMKLQIAPVTFPEEGVLIAQKSYFALPPEATDDDYPATIWWHEGFGGTTDAELTLTDPGDIDTPFAADGTEASCYMRFDLEGDGSYTPFIYAGLAGFMLERGATYDGAVDLLGVSTDREIRIGETPDSSGASIHALGLPALTGAGLVDPIGHSGRPVRVNCDGFTLFEGITAPAEVESAPIEEAYAVHYEVMPLWKMLEDYQFRFPISLDNITVQSAIEFVIQSATGLPDDQIEVEDSGLSVGMNGAQASGEWGFEIQLGDTGAEVLHRIFEAFLANWFYDFLPLESGEGMRFVAMAPDSLPDTAAVTLWGTVEEAMAQLVSEGYSEAIARANYEQRIWRNFRESGIDPEANEVRVTGANPKNGQPFQSYMIDEAARNPTTAPGSRPNNWLGRPLVYILIEPSLTTQTDCNDAVEKIADRVMPKRRMGSFESTLIRVAHNGRFLYKPDLVTLKNVYDGEDVTIRLSGFETSLESEADQPFMNRDASYFGEIESGAVAWRGSLRASNLEHAAAIAKERARRPQSFLGIVAAQRKRGGTVIFAP